MSAAIAVPMERSGKELIDASRPFAKDNPALSWFHIVTTFSLLAAATAGAVLAPWWYAQAALAVLAGLTAVRAFILYHDFMHLAILRGSLPARVLFWFYGLYVLTPMRVWKQTHNYHHAHTAKIVGSHVGSYRMVTTEMWQEMTAGDRLMYKITRHPLTILFGFFTIFIYGMCLSSFLRNPKRHWDSLLALIVHGAVAWALVTTFGWPVYIFGLFIPLFVATASGGYLFYAQHNFPDIEVKSRDEWSYTHAALYSSSYMKTGPIMRFFTGNIGYHHVHHLNATIPFYRLPEAMEAIPELRNPPVTSLAPKDIIACFKLKLWAADAEKMVGYPT